MKLNSKLTGGLAWAGLIVVLAVPSADMLTKPQAGSAAHVTSDMDAIRTASVENAPAVVAPTPAVRPASGSSADPVDSYLASGKKLPSYISDAPAEVASKAPATTVRLVVPDAGDAAERPASEEVAAVDSKGPLVAPVPYPASKRPVTPVVTASVDPASVSDEAPLILDEELIARREEAVARVLDDDGFEARPQVVTGDELEEWDSGSLAEYLERRGMMSEDGERQANADDYDEDGFFLDEGPNNDDDRRLIRRVRPRNFFFF